MPALALVRPPGYGWPVTRWALTLALLLVAPSAALAREPIISYVDETGTFRLYDEETEAEIDPPPAVPANFLGFRYGMSLNGRYIVFNDDPAPRKLHLLDRATNTQIPLPGIDVYAQPGSLTVSNSGLIGFDDNGNGPALVYSSATGQFVDTGLAADNGHRQTRLSGDGRFLATTCNDDNCIDDLGIGADPYVQDLSTKLDTAFPHDALADEEHPCIDADGSLVAVDKRASVLDMEKDIFLFDRSVSPAQPVAVPGLNTANKRDEFCVIDAGGDFIGFFHDNTAFRVYDRATQTFLGLPPDKEFGTTSLFSAPYSPPASPPASGGGNATPPPPPGDMTGPTVRRLRMTPRRFRPRRRATAFRFVLSEQADVRVVIRRRGKRMGAITRADRPAGPNRIFFNGRFRGRRLKPGAYVAVLFATDQAGNLSAPKLLGFRVLR
jgi:hypothetical protein